MILKDEMEKYLHYCEFQKQLDSKTVNAYRTDFEQFIEFMERQGIVLDKEGMNCYILYLHDSYKQKTVKRKLASIRALFHYLEEEEIIITDPFHGVKTKFKEERNLPKIIPKSIIEQLLCYLYDKAFAKESSEWQKQLFVRDIAVVEMLFATGLRISELCHLQSKFFDLDTGIICVQGKGKKERYLQIGNSDVLAMLKYYSKQHVSEINTHGYFFVNRYGEPLSEQSARRMIHRHTKAIRVNINVTPHMFRHSFATFLMEEDVNIRYIQKMLGHSSITTTEIYTYVATEKEREILRDRHPRNRMHVREYMS